MRLRTAHKKHRRRIARLPEDAKIAEFLLGHLARGSRRAVDASQELRRRLAAVKKGQ